MLSYYAVAVKLFLQRSWLNYRIGKEGRRRIKLWQEEAEKWYDRATKAEEKLRERE